jgi:hypothetical protein
VNCVAVRADVASNMRRRFVMMVWVPGKFLATTQSLQEKRSRSDDQQTRVRPDCGRPQNRNLFLFSNKGNVLTALFIAHSGHYFKPKFHIVPCGISAAPGFRCGSAPDKSPIPASAAGEGGPGPPGPRTGSSSGVLPGNSSGRGASPGSCIGGGTSGRGPPGGLSCGGSAGCPGLIGGSSCGSIGTTAPPSYCRSSGLER